MFCWMVPSSNIKEDNHDKLAASASHMREGRPPEARSKAKQTQPNPKPGTWMNIFSLVLCLRLSVLNLSFHKPRRAELPESWDLRETADAASNGRELVRGADCTGRKGTSREESSPTEQDHLGSFLAASERIRPRTATTSSSITRFDRRGREGRRWRVDEFNRGFRESDRRWQRRRVQDSRARASTPRWVLCWCWRRSSDFFHSQRAASSLLRLFFFLLLLAPLIIYR